MPHEVVVLRFPYSRIVSVPPWGQPAQSTHAPQPAVSQPRRPFRRQMLHSRPAYLGGVAFFNYVNLRGFLE